MFGFDLISPRDSLHRLLGVQVAPGNATFLNFPFPLFGGSPLVMLLLATCQANLTFNVAFGEMQV